VPQQFYSANPYIDINNINDSQVVCLISVSSNYNFNLSSPSLVSLSMNINTANSAISNAHLKLMANPNQTTIDAYNNALVNSFNSNQSLRASLKKYESTAEGKQHIVDKGLSQMCSQINATLFPKASNCFCQNIEPLSYCTIVFYQEFQSLGNISGRKIQVYFCYS
jgi:hypothetical protein